MSDLTTIWREVSAWPVEDKRALAARLLESVAQEEIPSSTRKEALQRLIGIWKVPNPPSDAEVEEILEVERRRKYG
jgi:hypothetical protein